MTKTDWQDVVRTVSDEVSEILGIKNKKQFSMHFVHVIIYIKIEQYNYVYKYYIYIYIYIYSIYTIDMCSAGNHQTM